MSARDEGLKAAAEVLARVMRTVAKVKTKTTADAVHWGAEGDDVSVRGGDPVGEYGWEPIQALMFDDNKRHPLFGNKQHWYHQGYYPITEATVRTGTDEATEAFADAFVDPFLTEHGILK